MKPKLISRTFAAVLVATGISSAFGQSAIDYDQTHHNPYIKVPSSTRFVNRTGIGRTHYVIYTGTPAAPGFMPMDVTHGPALVAPTVPGYHPDQLRTAYGITGGGSGTIAIVDAFDNPTALSDFNTFAQTFNLPQETSTDPTNPNNKVFQVVYANGTKPATDAGWAGEIALDIEWAHAMAPNAKIVLVETADNGFPNLPDGDKVAANITGVREVSNSWGGLEFGGQTSFDSDFLHPGVVFFASSGDIGGLLQWPSSSPNVVGVGGTTLMLGSSNQVTSETAWSGAGGGISVIYPRPDFQAPVASVVGSSRGTPDVAAVADPETGVAVYSQTAFQGWAIVGGTSLACPVTTAITNVRGNFTQPVNYTSSSHRELQRIYFNLLDKYYRDITQGTAGSFSARPGYDLITGIGRPDGLFPNYTPPSTLLPAAASKFQGASSTGALVNLGLIDGLTYNVTTALTSVGQSAALQMDFKMDRDPSLLSGIDIPVSHVLPLGSGIQYYLYNWSTNSLVYNSAFVGTGAVSTNTIKIPASFIQPGTLNIRIVARALKPLRLGTVPFTLAVDRGVLEEITVPAWDINAPL